MVDSKGNNSFGCDSENVDPLENIKAKCKALGVDVDAHGMDDLSTNIENNSIKHVRGSTKAQKNTLKDKLPEKQTTRSSGHVDEPMILKKFMCLWEPRYHMCTYSCNKKGFYFVKYLLCSLLFS